MAPKRDRPSPSVSAPSSPVYHFTHPLTGESSALARLFGDERSLLGLGDRSAALADRDTALAERADQLARRVVDLDRLVVVVVVVVAVVVVMVVAVVVVMRGRHCVVDESHRG